MRRTGANCRGKRAQEELKRLRAMIEERVARTRPESRPIVLGEYPEELSFLNARSPAEDAATAGIGTDSRPESK
jgi:hypothetical protein